MMRLLIIANNSIFPIKDGAALRIYHLIKNMPQEWNIDLICARPETEEAEKEVIATFRKVYFADYSEVSHQEKLKYTEMIKYLITPVREVFPFYVPYSPYLDSLIQKTISVNTYKAILCFTAASFGFYLSNIHSQNITCDVCDSTSLYARSMRKSNSFLRREWFSLYYAYLYNLRWESKFLKMCNKLVTITERDKKWLGKTVPEKRIHVVANGVDSNYFNPDTVLPGTSQDLVVFTGVMGYRPNHEAMVYCLREVWPIIKKKAPEAKLRIVGRSPKPELVELAKQQKDVEVTGEVADIRIAIKGATVYLCPIRLGAGMKNKILEALSMGIPVVTTNEGAVGIEFKHEEVGYIANTSDDLASYTATLLKKTSSWENLSRAAREFILDKYSWKSQAEKLSNILLK